MKRNNTTSRTELMKQVKENRNEWLMKGVKETIGSVQIEKRSKELSEAIQRMNKLTYKPSLLERFGAYLQKVNL